MAAELSLGASSYTPKRETGQFAEEVIAEIGFSFWLKPSMCVLREMKPRTEVQSKEFVRRSPTAQWQQVDIGTTASHLKRPS
jgi:hypothetical protein